MSNRQQEKQKIFREKLQAEGADAFADGPRPWEQWDESGHQDDNRIWEGSSRRIYPKQKAKRSMGDRLLSGLAVVTLATLVVGIAGVYLSTSSTPQLASTAIHPAPIVADRQLAAKQDIAADTTAALSSLETLSPPAAGNSASVVRDNVALEPPLQPSVVAVTDPADTVAVETVITRSAVTTTVYTQQPSQQQPELLALIETTPPGFASKPAGEQQPAASTTIEDTRVEQVEAADEPVVSTDIKDTHIEQVEAADEPVVSTDIEDTRTEQLEAADEPVVSTDIEDTRTEQVEAADEPVSIAQLEVDTTEAAIESPPATPALAPVLEELTDAAESETSITQTESAVEKRATTETPASIAMNSSSPPVAATPDISREIETTIQTPVLPDPKTGKWVINLSSYTRLSTAERMLAVFKQKGIDAEIFSTTVNDKPMHRIRIAGFQSSRTARSEIPAIEKILGLDDAWVSRR